MIPRGRGPPGIIPPGMPMPTNMPTRGPPPGIIPRMGVPMGLGAGYPPGMPLPGAVRGGIRGGVSPPPGIVTNSNAGLGGASSDGLLPTPVVQSSTKIPSKDPREDPECWKSTQTPEGHTYYYNTITKETTWTKPKCLQTTPSPMNWENLEGTPWQKVYLESGAIYFYNTLTRHSSWTTPPELLSHPSLQTPSTPSSSSEPQLASKDEPKPAESEPREPKQKQEEGQTQKEPEPEIEISVFEGHLEGGNYPSSASVLEEEKLKKLESIKRKLHSGTDLSAATGTGVGIDAGVKRQKKEEHSVQESQVQDQEGGKESARAGDGGEGARKKEEAEEAFLAMLIERKVSRFSKWEKELPKLAFDPRFTAVPKEERKNLFEAFVKGGASGIDPKAKLEEVKARQRRIFSNLLNELLGSGVFTSETTFEEAKKLMPSTAASSLKDLSLQEQKRIFEGMLSSSGSFEKSKT